MTPNPRKFFTTTLTAMLCAAALAACGGGGSEGPPPPPADTAEGLWTGVTSDGDSMEGVVLENGEYWVMYHANGVLYGVVQGTGTSNNGSFTSTNGLDFFWDGTVTPVTVSASYRARASLQGVATPSGNAAPVTFTATYDAAYETPATAAAVAGTWRGRLNTGETYSFNVGANGAFTGAGSFGCTFGGTIAPRASGKAVYNVSVTFNGGACAFGTQTFNGVGVVEGSGSAQVLYAAALDSARSSGFITFSTR